jgi:protein required for attachment to host cells
MSSGPAATPYKLAHGAWVFVGDGQKAMFLINDGDENFPICAAWRSRSTRTPRHANGAATLQGGPNSSVGEIRSAVGETDGHELEKERFAAAIADRINKVALSGAFNQLVIVAPPKILGDLRRKFTKETETKINAGSHSSYDPGDRTFVRTQNPMIGRSRRFSGL